MSKKKTINVDPAFAEKLRKLLVSSRFRPLIDFFGGMPEDSRLALAPICLDWNRSHKAEWSESLIPDTQRFFSSAVQYDGNPWLAAQLAVIASSNRKDVLKAVREIGFTLYIEEEVLQILYDRRPPWIGSLLEEMLQGRDIFLTDPIWKTYRHIVRNRWAEPSYHPVWIPLMFMHMNSFTYEESLRRKDQPLADRLEEDDDLLKHDIWSLLEIERFPANFSYTTLDGRDLWKQAYCDLIKRGRLPEDRVVDACFRAFTRPFTDFQMKWFVQLLRYLVDRLPWTDMQLAGQADRFLGLIDHRLPAVSGYGSAILERLFKAELLPDEKVLEAIQPILRGPAKGKVKNAVSIMEKIARKRADLRSLTCRILVTSLAHASKDVQTKSLDLILKYGNLDDPELSDSILTVAPLLAASVRSRLPVRFQEEPANPLEPNAGYPPEPLVFQAQRPMPVDPIDTLDELIDSATLLLEDSANATEIERFLDGVARLGTNRPDDFGVRTGPLLKRAFQLIGITLSSNEEIQRFHTYYPLSGVDLAGDIRYFILGWLTGDRPEPVSGSMKLGKFTLTKAFSTEPDFIVLRLLAERMKNVLRRVLGGESCRLLSTPTHVGGWIDTEIFVQRIADEYSQRKRNGFVDDHDRVLALLRLIPDRRKTALQKIDETVIFRDDYTNAVRYALGADDVDVASGTAPQYWIAASRCRRPSEDDPIVASIFGEYGPDGAEAAKYDLTRKSNNGHYRAYIVETCELQLARNPRCDGALFPTVGFHLPPSNSYWEARDSFDWLLTVWPQNQDAVGDLALKSNLGHLERSAKSEGLLQYVTAIRSMNLPVRKIGAWCILSALTMRNGETHTAATDTLIATVSDGRLTVENAVSAAHELFELKLLTTSRWLKALEIVKDQSTSHAGWVASFLESVVCELDSRSMSGFLELLYETLLSLRRPLGKTGCRTFLSGTRLSGKAAKLAKKLLEMK